MGREIITTCGDIVMVVGLSGYVKIHSLLESHEIYTYNIRALGCHKHDTQKYQGET